MKVTEIGFRMNVEVGPFKHEHVEVRVQLGPRDTVEKAFEFAKQQARELLGVDVTDEEVKAAKLVLTKANRSKHVRDEEF